MNEKPVNEPNEHPHKVTITINGKDFTIQAGKYPVQKLKNLADPKIPKEETLCIMIAGVPKALGEHEHVDIKGGEIFASNCPSGGAS
jgi:hypothetical protein